MTELEQAVPEPEEQYSKTGLVIFGILQLILGAICLLAVAGMTAATFVKPPNADSAAADIGIAAILPGIVMYLAAAVWFVWMGIGSIKARRWARDLILAVTWIWLLTGIGGLISMAYFMPDMMTQMAGEKEITPRMTEMAKNMMIGFMLFAMIIVPGVLLLYYSTQHVKQTVLHLDLVERWTGRVPLPVLVLLGFCLWGIISVFSMGAIGWVIPLFGAVVKGTPGAVLTIASGLLTLYAIWLIYKLRTAGWWLVLGLTVFWVISMLVTISQVGLAEYFALVDFPGMPAGQMDWMDKSMAQNNTVMTVQFIITSAAFLGFLLYTKKFFAKPASQN